MTDPTALDRIASSWRKLTRAEFPRFDFTIMHEYAVAEADDTTFEGRPTDADVSPQLPRRIPYRPALAGSSCRPVVGCLAYVMFANADESKPVLVGFSTPLPVSSRLDVEAGGKVTVGDPAASVGAVALVGDQTYSGTLALSAGVQVLTFTPVSGAPILSPPSTIPLAGVIFGPGALKLQAEKA